MKIISINSIVVVVFINTHNFASSFVESNIWTLQADILGDNLSSIKLHEKCGFRLAGFREKLGNLNGKWTDIRLYERRSKVMGVNEHDDNNRINADYFHLLV